MAAAATAAQTYRTHDGLTVDGSTGIILAYPGAVNPPRYQITLAERAATAAWIDADLAAYGHDLQDEAAF